MSNRFHVLLRVPDTERARVTDKELMRRYRVLYPEPTQYQRINFKILEKKLLENEDGFRSCAEGSSNECTMCRGR